MRRNAGGPDEEDRAAGYVECTECGHPIEHHDLTGCLVCASPEYAAAGVTPCTVAWTVKAIQAARRRVGLVGRFDRAHLTTG